MSPTRGGNNYFRTTRRPSSPGSPTVSFAGANGADGGSPGAQFRSPAEAKASLARLMMPRQSRYANAFVGLDNFDPLFDNTQKAQLLVRDGSQQRATSEAQMYAVRQMANPNNPALANAQKNAKNLLRPSSAAAASSAGGGTGAFRSTTFSPFKTTTQSLGALRGGGAAPGSLTNTDLHKRDTRRPQASKFFSDMAHMKIPTRSSKRNLDHQEAEDLAELQNLVGGDAQVLAFFEICTVLHSSFCNAARVQSTHEKSKNYRTPMRHRQAQLAMPLRRLPERTRALAHPMSERAKQAPPAAAKSEKNRKTPAKQLHRRKQPKQTHLAPQSNPTRL